MKQKENESTLYVFGDQTLNQLLKGKGTPRTVRQGNPPNCKAREPPEL